MTTPREVKASRKDDKGNITHLCNPEATWLPRASALVISDIESNEYRYFVKIGQDEVDIHVVNGSSGKYLRTDPDKTDSNNLDSLPGC